MALSATLEGILKGGRRDAAGHYSICAQKLPAEGLYRYTKRLSDLLSHVPIITCVVPSSLRTASDSTVKCNGETPQCAMQRQRGCNKPEGKKGAFAPLATNPTREAPNTIDGASTKDVNNSVLGCICAATMLRAGTGLDNLTVGVVVLAVRCCMMDELCGPAFHSERCAASPGATVLRDHPTGLRYQRKLLLHLSREKTAPAPPFSLSGPRSPRSGLPYTYVYTVVQHMYLVHEMSRLPGTHVGTTAAKGSQPVTSLLRGCPQVHHITTLALA